MLFNESFWIAVSFALFICLVFKPLKNLLFKVLDERTSKIKKELLESKNLEENAEDLLSDYKRKIEGADKEVEHLLASTNDEIKFLHAKAKSDSERYLNRRTSQVMSKISSQEEFILNQLRREIVELSVAVAEQIVKGNITKELSDKLNFSSVDCISKKIH